MAVTGSVIAAATVVGTVAEHRATKAQLKAQKREARINRRTASIENVRRARRAVAQRRIQEAEILQAGATEGVRASSGIAGAVGSLRTQTAANIGAANTQLAGSIAANNALIRGSRAASRYGTVASVAGATKDLALLEYKFDPFGRQRG